MKSWKTSALVATVALAFSSQAFAQITQPAEYAKFVGRSNVVEASADFGDQVNLRDGKLVFRATDIELPGIGPTIRITRSFDPNGLGTYFHESSGNALGVWEVEIPRIATITANPLGASTYSPVGWQVAGATTAEKNARCTGFSAPPRVSFPYDAARGWDAHEWWNGYHLVDDTGNTQSVMTRASTSVRSDMPLMTTGNWLIGCLSATSNGEAGEAFLAVAPDGTKYWFDYLVYTDADTLQKPLWSEPSGDFSARAPDAGTPKTDPSLARRMPETDQLERRYAAMLATRVEDRFGNWVTYHYTAGRLDSIDASDGRHVGLAYPSGSAATVTVGSGSSARTWSYAVAGEPGDQGDLQQLTVTRPDLSTWQYALRWQVSPSMSVADMEESPTCPFDSVESNPYVDQVVTSPAGATLTIRATSRRFGRSYVPRDCFNSRPDIPDSGIMKYPKEWFAFAVTSRTVSGPGMTTATWNYSYAPAVSSWLQDCPTPTSCASTVWTDITRPDGSRQRSIFSNKFDATENKLLREEEYAAGGALLRATDHLYATVVQADWSSNPYPWPVSVGNDQQTRQNPETSGQWAPVRKTAITQQGKTFTWEVPATCGTGSSPCFDQYARPTKVVKSSTP